MCNCQEPPPAGPGSPRVVAAAVPPVIPPEVPLAKRIPVDGAGADGIPEAGLPPGPSSGPVPGAGPLPPPFKVCRSLLRGGCYVLSFQPSNKIAALQGTLRVDRSAPDGGPDNLIASGDLYRRRHLPSPFPTSSPSTLLVPDFAEPAQPSQESVAAAASRPDSRPFPLPPSRQIPIFPRSQYHSYLKVISVSAPVVVPARQACTVTLVVEQFDYVHPPVGSFKGSFPVTASRTVTVVLTQAPAPTPFTGPHFVGHWFESGVDKGPVTLSWVSDLFRRATVEIDTLAGAVAPKPVPDGSGGMEYFNTIYARHGWDLTVINDQTNVPVPPGVDPADCWSAGNLHSLMAANRSPTVDLDTDWRIHLMVVPAKLGCGRGVMYDQINVPREGCASFSDDGYPVGDSSNFGLAENEKQRDVARAFLRSATHEITHTFNQIHQEQETTADNSIMTTTPSVADVLGGPTSGEPGVFPDQINLAVNTTVRHHLVHMPDPVIRPGGWPFGSWFGTNVPEASDRYRFDSSELGLAVTLAGDGVVLGQPVELSWALTNHSGAGLLAPNNVSLEGQFTSITITDADGRTSVFRPFTIVCDAVRIAELAPGDSVSAAHRVFWSSEGFAFPRPGLYRINVAVTWSAQGVPVGADSSIEVFVQYPTSTADNEAAGLVLNSEVGKWVALGGDAYHLTEATARLRELSARAEADREPRLLAGFRDLLPHST